MAGMRAALRVLGLVVVPTLALTTLGGCGGSDDASSTLPSRLERIRPTATAPPWLRPDTAAHLDLRRYTGEGYTIEVPASWREQTLPTQAKDEVPTVLFEEQGHQPTDTVRLGVVVDPKPKSDAIEQSQVLAVAKSAAGVKDMVRSEVPWPGAIRAVFLDWTEELGGQGGTLRTQQLMVQVKSDLIVNVVAVAPAAGFEDTGLQESLVTFHVTP